MSWIAMRRAQPKLMWVSWRSPAQMKEFLAMKDQRSGAAKCNSLPSAPVILAVRVVIQAFANKRGASSAHKASPSSMEMFLMSIWS